MVSTSRISHGPVVIIWRLNNDNHLSFKFIAFSQTASWYQQVGLVMVQVSCHISLLVHGVVWSHRHRHLRVSWGWGCCIINCLHLSHLSGGLPTAALLPLDQGQVGGHVVIVQDLELGVLGSDAHGAVLLCELHLRGQCVPQCTQTMTSQLLEGTVTEHVQVLLQVSACGLRAGPDGHGLAVIVVG